MASGYLVCLRLYRAGRIFRVLSTFGPFGFDSTFGGSVAECTHLLFWLAEYTWLFHAVLPVFVLASPLPPLGLTTR